MGLGGVAIAVLPSMIYPKQPFSDGLGGSGGEECLLTLHHSSPCVQDLKLTVVWD